MLPRIGVIGGSGLYKMEGLEFVREELVETPFGKPSDSYRIFKLETSAGAAELVFLPRHGTNHVFNPSEINYRANIFGMKILGVKWLIAVSAVGSLKEDIAPGKIVLVDQFIDRTTKRPQTFFENGIAAHVPFGHPVCDVLRGFLGESCESLGIEFQNGGVYVNMEGPAFSTKAESLLHRSWGASVIGMTNLTEARLAREAEISLATIAMATDFDAWHDEHAHVTVDQVVLTMKGNSKKAQDIIKSTIPRILAFQGEHPMEHTLKGAIMTATEAISDDIRTRLAPITGKYLGIPSSYVLEEQKHQAHYAPAAPMVVEVPVITWVGFAAVAALAAYVLLKK
eukprot:m.33105 g.33105  ORF g.33105 m.33105 type:complete len:340 (-) comp42790_c0_seq1:72-1091(-)